MYIQYKYLGFIDAALVLPSKTTLVGTYAILVATFVLDTTSLLRIFKDFFSSVATFAPQCFVSYLCVVLALSAHLRINVSYRDF